jgi:hypothetical protein
MAATLTGAVGSAQTICNNTAPAAFTETEAPTGGTSSYTYQWESSPNGTSSWTPIPATTFTSPAGTGGVTFSWTNSNPSIGLPASGNGNQPAFTAAQTGSATITVTPYYNGCDGTPATYTITVSSCLVPINPHLRSRVIGN